MPVGPDADETKRTPPAPNSQPIFGSGSKSIATETSSTTPGKIVKKARADGPEPRSLFQPEASPVPSQPDTGATRAPSLDDVACLKQRNQELEDEKIALEKQVEELNEKLNQLSLNQRSQEQSGRGWWGKCTSGQWWCCPQTPCPDLQQKFRWETWLV